MARQDTGLSGMDGWGPASRVTLARPASGNPFSSAGRQQSPAQAGDEVKIGLPAGEKQYDARVIGGDPLTDIAVLKVDAEQPFPALTLADSDKLQVGDVSLAIGNPFGVGQTVTMGIISALSRGGFGITAYENFIQKDAAINPGNSGGALVDVEGRLIGVNTAIMSRSGGFQGVGFAVPINMARGVMDQLIKSGKVSRGYLGINIQPLTADLAREFGLADESSGVLVGGVMARGAAAKAGVIDGFLTKDLTGICVDQDVCENPRKENRLRFTFAHEVGHLVLHSREIRLCRFRTSVDWMRFREDFEEEDLFWFEQQAYEFAGRLLVPRRSLVEEFRRLAPKIQEFKRRGGSDEEKIVQAISRSICGKYAVSPDVIARRIKSERLRI